MVEEWGYSDAAETSSAPRIDRTHQWEESQWHYLDDSGAVQGPYNTETIGEWFDAGALGLERYVSIDGADWVKLAESAPFVALWSHKLEGGGGANAGVDETYAHIESEAISSAASEAWGTSATVDAAATAVVSKCETG